MGTPIHDDVALPALALADVVEHRDAARRLHDAAEADAIADRAKIAELWHSSPTHQTPHRQGGVLRVVIAIDGRGVVARGRIRIPRRGFWVVLAASTRRLVVLAGLGRLQQDKPEFAFDR